MDYQEKLFFVKKHLYLIKDQIQQLNFYTEKIQKKKTLFIDKNGISDAWKYSRLKEKINFKDREKKLLKLLDLHRGKYGEYDCIVPGGGGKDSCYASHILKFKYGMIH